MGYNEDMASDSGAALQAQPTVLNVAVGLQKLHQATRYCKDSTIRAVNL